MGMREGDGVLKWADSKVWAALPGGYGQRPCGWDRLCKGTAL
jgi:hypothetical protein